MTTEADAAARRCAGDVDPARIKARVAPLTFAVHQRERQGCHQYPTPVVAVYRRRLRDVDGHVHLRCGPQPRDGQSQGWGRRPGRCETGGRPSATLN